MDERNRMIGGRGKSCRWEFSTYHSWVEERYYFTESVLPSAEYFSENSTEFLKVDQIQLYGVLSWPVPSPVIDCEPARLVCSGRHRIIDGEQSNQWKGEEIPLPPVLSTPQPHISRIFGNVPQKVIKWRPITEQVGAKKSVIQWEGIGKKKRIGIRNDSRNIGKSRTMDSHPPPKLFGQTGPTKFSSSFRIGTNEKSQSSDRII